MSRFSWDGADPSQASAGLEGPSGDRPVSCMSAFNDDDPRLDAQPCKAEEPRLDTEASSYNSDHTLQAECAHLLHQRKRLLIEQQKSSEHHRTLKLHAETLKALLQEANVEQRRLKSELQLLPCVEEQPNTPIGVPHERSSSKVRDSSNSLTGEAARQGQYSMIGKTGSTALGQFNASHGFAYKENSQQCWKTSSSSRCATDTRSRHQTSMSPTRGEVEDYIVSPPEPEPTLNLSLGNIPTTARSSRSSEHQPESSSTPFLNCVALKSESPTTSPSIGSLSTRSCSRTPSICTSLHSNRSSISYVSMLPPTPEVQVKPRILSMSRVATPALGCDDGPELANAVGCQPPSSHGCAGRDSKILRTPTHDTGENNASALRTEKKPQIIAASRDAPNLIQTDMATTRAKLAELEEQIRLAKGRAALGYIPETVDADGSTLKALSCAAEAPATASSQKAFNMKASRLASPPRSSASNGYVVTSSNRLTCIALGGAPMQSMINKSCRQEVSTPVVSKGRNQHESKSVGRSQSPSSHSAPVRRASSAPRVGGAHDGVVIRTTHPAQPQASTPSCSAKTRSISSPTIMVSGATTHGNARRPSISPRDPRANVQRHSYAQQPSPQERSPRTASGQRRCDHISWARRGLTGLSPSPRGNRAIEEQDCVRVLCRVRPLEAKRRGSASDARTHENRSVAVVDGSAVEVRDRGGSLIRSFVIDGVFGENAKTDQLFASIRSVLQKALLGQNAAILAYGPTGAGKSHTMYGDAFDIGLVPRAAAELLSKAGGRPVRLSMVELHNETLTDLLLPPGTAAPPHLEIRACRAGGNATVEGLREVSSANLTSLLTTIGEGLARRHTAATNLNSTSSRSHVQVSLSIGKGTLSLVDLAGVERVKRSGAEGNVLREAQSINRSLYSLGDVVDALRRGSSHIPIRNSRLARLVSGTLSGGCESAVVVCIAPETDACDETVAALCFAERVRRIPGGTPAPVPGGAGAASARKSVSPKRRTSPARERLG